VTPKISKGTQKGRHTSGRFGHILLRAVRPMYSKQIPTTRWFLACFSLFVFIWQILHLGWCLSWMVFRPKAVHGSLGYGPESRREE
jgi:hypothetical protein